MNERIERFAQGPRAGWLAFLWGLAEATLFFLVPDIMLTWLALRGWRTALRCCLLALLGALAGGVLMLQIAGHHPDRARAALERVPGIDTALIQEVGEDTKADGAGAVVMGSFTGKPYKIYAVEWGATGRSIGPFLLASLLGRLTRFLAVVVLTRVLVSFLPSWMKTGLWALLWLGFYAWYLGVFRR